MMLWCMCVCLKCDKDFIFLFQRREKKRISKMEHLFFLGGFFCFFSQIPILKCFWILFPSLILMAGEYKEWLWAFGWITTGECELLCFCFQWLTVPMSLNKLLSFFFFKEIPPSIVVNVFFIFKRFNRLKIFPHKCTQKAPGFRTCTPLFFSSPLFGSTESE